MKHRNQLLVYLLFFLVLGLNIAQAQDTDWEAPMPVTDDESFNRNANMITYKNDALLFWEKSFDANSTAIYMRNLTDMDDEMAVLSQEGVYFRNPQLMRIGDDSFYLFYETNASGSFDIFYTIYSQGVFEEPQLLHASDYDDSNLRVTEIEMVWENNHQIYFSSVAYDGGFYFTDPVMVSEGECTNPVLAYHTVYYERIIDELSAIYVSVYDEVNNEWDSPLEFYSIGDNTSLRMVSSSEYGWEYSVLLWESYEDDHWQLKAYASNSQEIEDLPLSGLSKMTPDGLYFDIPITKTNKYIELSYFAYVETENEQDDIFVTQLFDVVGNAFNITNSEAKDSHPQLFYCPRNNQLLSYLIWESDRNNHKQLFMSIDGFWANTSDIETNPLQLKLAPNPCVDHLQITFFLDTPSDVMMGVYNLKGQLIRQINQPNQTQGLHHIFIDMIALNRNRLKAGVYLVSLRTNDFVVRKKVVVSR